MEKVYEKVYVQVYTFRNFIQHSLYWKKISTLQIVWHNYAYNSSRNSNIRKTTHAFAPRSINFKLQQEVFNLSKT